MCENSNLISETSTFILNSTLFPRSYITWSYLNYVTVSSRWGKRLVFWIIVVGKLSRQGTTSESLEATIPLCIYLSFVSVNEYTTNYEIMSGCSKQNRYDWTVHIIFINRPNDKCYRLREGSFVFLSRNPPHSRGCLFENDIYLWNEGNKWLLSIKRSFIFEESLTDIYIEIRTETICFDEYFEIFPIRFLYVFKKQGVGLAIFIEFPSEILKIKEK